MKQILRNGELVTILTKNEEREIAEAVADFIDKDIIKKVKKLANKNN